MSDTIDNSGLAANNLVARLKRAVIGKFSNVVQLRYFQLKTFLRLARYTKDVGHGTYIDRSVQVLGWRSISIGHSTTIGEGSWLNVNQRVEGQKHIVIGNNCFIGKRNFFSSGNLVLVGDYCMTGIDCRFMSADHRFDSPWSPYITTGVTGDKTIRLGANVWLGAGVSILGNVTVGYGSIIGASALVNRDIPPFSIAFGNPCRVHKRYDFALGCWVRADELESSHESLMPSESDYLARLRDEHPSIIMPLLASSSTFGDLL